MFRKLRSNQIRRHSLNLSHVVVKNGLLATAIPFDGYARPIRFSDGATVGLIVSPAHAVSYFEKSGLVAGHYARNLRSKKTAIIRAPHAGITKVTQELH
jgi:hypothetical protein